MNPPREVKFAWKNIDPGPKKTAKVTYIAGKNVDSVNRFTGAGGEITASETAMRRPTMENAMEDQVLIGSLIVPSANASQ